MEYGFWLVIIFTIFYEPIIGYFDFQKFKVDIKENQNARLKYYINTIIGLWVPTIFILLLVFISDLTLNDIGLSIPSINTDILGSFVTYSVFAIAFLYLVGILYYSIGYQFSDKIRTKFAQTKEKEWENVNFSIILPITKKEKRLWSYVSLIAGVTEEIIYRGFLLFALSYLFPNFSIWLIIMFSSLLFGLAHTYQGFTIGVLRTTVVGVIFSVLYIGISSILPLIVLHFLIDYVAKLGDVKAQN
ncbi:CPBP family intramembrane glutamic endopeptidase [Sporosarcina sp. FSL W7-1349]|uniref:CPBP family intramembrane glutamic endopeptidase n=1 Tax=Sporosarcina sp. FSL W7-1349 TaxID=2921561 RepID=UPI0030F86104